VGIEAIGANDPGPKPDLVLRRRCRQAGRNQQASNARLGCALARVISGCARSEDLAHPGAPPAATAIERFEHGGERSEGHELATQRFVDGTFDRPGSNRGHQVAQCPRN
jgi:hypothetical protein